ncbi:hypothetical protein L7F22_028598 [Adiantum nelumboides]|nr:hypothetical protein [Adiantum nelumboides]
MGDPDICRDEIVANDLQEPQEDLDWTSFTIPSTTCTVGKKMVSLISKRPSGASTSRNANDGTLSATVDAIKCMDIHGATIGGVCKWGDLDDDEAIDGTTVDEGSGRDCSTTCTVGKQTMLSR